MSRVKTQIPKSMTRKNTWHFIRALLMSGKFWASLKNKSSKLHLWNILNPLGMEQKSWVRDRVRLRNADLGIIWEVNYTQSRIIYMIMDFILVSISKYNDRHLCSMIMLTLKVKVKVTQSCLTLCDPIDYTVHEILQARILEWVAVHFSGGSSQPRDQTHISSIGR